MASKPILFSTPMIQAIIAGTKTQTRRIIKPKYSNTDIQFRTDKYGTYLVEMQNDVPEPVKNDDGTTTHHLRAYSKLKPIADVGDVLWCRETWIQIHTDREFEGRTSEFVYRADEKQNEEKFGDIKNGAGKRFIDSWKWKPSIFMPKDACRLFLKVTGVRAERLQDITDDDALSEGIDISSLRTFPDYKNYLCKDKDPHHIKFGLLNPILSYKSLWQSINGKDSWDANPWVWVYEFRLTDKPKDFCNG